MNVMQVMPYQQVDKGKSKTGFNKQTSKPDQSDLQSIKIDLKQVDVHGSTSESEDLTPMSNFEKAFERAKQTVQTTLGDHKRGSPKNVYLNLQITNQQLHPVDGTDERVYAT